MPKNDWQASFVFVFSNRFFYTCIVCRNQTWRQCCRLFSLLSYNYLIQIYYENEFTFLSIFSVIRLWKWHPKEIICCIFFLPKTFCTFNSISIFWKVLCAFMHQTPWKFPLSHSCIPWMLLIFIFTKWNTNLLMNLNRNAFCIFCYTIEIALNTKI